MLEKLKRRIPDAADDALLEDLLDDAAAMILAYTGRDAVPEALEAAQLALAAAAYNRMGMEGERDHGVCETAEGEPEWLCVEVRGWSAHLAASLVRRPAA